MEEGMRGGQWEDYRLGCGRGGEVGTRAGLRSQPDHSRQMEGGSGGAERKDRWAVSFDQSSSSSVCFLLLCLWWAGRAHH